MNESKELVTEITASICLIILAVGFLGVSTAQARSADPVRAGATIPGHYIVVFKDAVEHPAALADEQVTRRDAELGSVYRHSIEGYSAQGLSKEDVGALRQDPKVAYVVPDRRVSLQEEEIELEDEEEGETEVGEATIPTGISRTFATANGTLLINGFDDHAVDADVAVIDTGIDYKHPDLNVVARTDCVTGICIDNTGEDTRSHGTHVAGTIGAIDNGIGVVGMAPGVRLWAVKVLDDEGRGTESGVTAGVDWVTGHAGEIEVANMSLGCRCAMPALEKAINKSTEAGVVYAVAAGNYHIDAKNVAPASDPNVITVSALVDYDGIPGGAGSAPTGKGCKFGNDDTLAKFSDFGSDVEIAAPGACILSTMPGGTYGYKSGTSMASPHVAGAAAILASESNPNSKADVEAIRARLIEMGRRAEEEGVSTWTDTSGDGIQEPLLYVGGEPANPDWRIEGSTLAELEAWEPYESQGAFHTEFQSGTAQVAIACQTAGTGTLGLSETIALTECETKLNGATSTRCAPADTSIDLDGELKSEDPLVVFQLGSLCALGREAELKAGPGFTMQPGPEAVEFAAQMSETTETGAGASASVSIPSTMTMTGKYEGQKFAYAGDFESLNPDWRIEGSTLAELGAWEPYESQGAFHTEFEAGSTQVVISCQTDGTGTLGLSETIALTECETKLNGATSTRCAPADTSIDLDGELKSEDPLVVFQTGTGLCAIGREVELKAGPGFTLQPGPEAVEFAAQMSETTETGAGSSASVSIPSTMTMTGKYEGQKFAYAGDFESLNPDWRIEGSTLAELEAWEPYESQGAFHTEFQSGTAQVAIACQTAGTGTLGLSETIALTECETKLNGATSTRCAPADTSIDLDGELKSEDPLVVFQTGTGLCAIGREVELKAGPGFTLQPGPEAVEFAAQMSETTETGAGASASVSIPSTMTMTGKYEGSEFGYE